MTTAPPPILPAEIPPELNRWNWGAFLLNWIWGVGNNTFIALLCFIPGVAIVMVFVLGAKGSRWAWKNGRWDSIEHFKRVQRLWAIWGVVIWFGAILLFGGIFGGVFYGLRHSDAYELGAATLQSNADAIAILGAPIETGYPTGSIRINGSTGRALLDFSVTGPKASGRIFLEAIKQDGVWSLRNLRLKVDGRDNAIDLLKQARAELTFRPHPEERAFVRASKDAGPAVASWFAERCAASSQDGAKRPLLTMRSESAYFA